MSRTSASRATARKSTIGATGGTGTTSRDVPARPDDDVLPVTPDDRQADVGRAARRPRAAVRSGDLGARIATAAADLLDETGDEASVTLRAVARRAGVSAPAIYGHYPDVQSIFLFVVQDAFAELSAALQAAAVDDAAPSAAGELRPPAAARLRAVCAAYLAFAARRPQRYRLMFGGLWTATRAIESAAVGRDDVQALGQHALTVFVSALADCVRDGASTSRDTFADAVGLWLALHGLAHQRVVTAAFPWPADIENRIITAQAHLTTP